MSSQIEHTKNKLYWAFNLPLQLSVEHEDADNEDSPITGYQILNYMPRKERCITLGLDECLNGEETREEFLTKAAEILENLAAHFKFAANHPNHQIYYPDERLPEVSR